MGGVHRVGGRGWGKGAAGNIYYCFIPTISFESAHLVFESAIAVK